MEEAVPPGGAARVEEPAMAVRAGQELGMVARAGQEPAMGDRRDEPEAG
jgi:hypothetical protein